MTWIATDYVQRAGTPKADKSELQFLCFANCIMVINICIKFQENISNSFQVTEWTSLFFQSSKGHNSKSRLTRVTVLVFCTLSHDALHLCEVSSNGFQLTEQTQIVEMAMFNTYCVQRAATQKVG